jgi:hypothetical protein
VGVLNGDGAYGGRLFVRRWDQLGRRGVPDGMSLRGLCWRGREDFRWLMAGCMVFLLLLWRVAGPEVDVS